jgi:chloride channel protein, CIC family
LRFSEEAFHLLLAGCVGVIGGLMNLLFFIGLRAFQRVALQETGDIVEVAEFLPGWQRLIFPMIGGLIAGLILYGGHLLIGRQGTSNLLEVVVVGDGRLPFRTAVIKGLSSLVSIGTGASIGREGAITQLSATLASKWGQLAHWPPYRLRLLVACGVASGLAAAYNAPVAGAVFAAQIVLGNFSMNLFAPLVFSSVVASMLSRTFFGIDPWYVVPAFDFTRVTQLPWYLLLGGLCGGLGALFLKMLHRSEEFFQNLRMPLYAKLALGGLLVGVIAVEFPGVWGNGYIVTNRILNEQFPLVELLALFLAKLVATMITVGSGAVGGVLTPTLFLGAGLGAAFGEALHYMHFAEPMPTGSFALVGMGAVLAATTRSPLLAMILILEISLNYSLMPPLMVACVVATLVARRLHPSSIYTEPLRAKGVLVERETAELGAATQQRVGDLMRAPVEPLRETATLPEIADRFLTSSNNFLPVVDANRRLIGVVALQDLKEYLTAGEELTAVIAYDVMRPPPPCLTPNQRLIDALPGLLASELRNVPVVNTYKENRLIGALSRSQALGILSEAIAARTASQESSEPASTEGAAVQPAAANKEGNSSGG